MKRGRKAWVCKNCGGVQLDHSVACCWANKDSAEYGLEEGIFLTTDEHAEEVREAEQRGAGAALDHIYDIPCDFPVDIHAAAIAYADKLFNEGVEAAAKLVYGIGIHEVGDSIRALKRGE